MAEIRDRTSVRTWAGLLVLLGSMGASCAGGGPSSSPERVPVPDVRLSLQFGEAPVEGEVTFEPEPGSNGTWHALVDLDEDGAFDFEAPIPARVRLAYRFTDPGVHRIRVVLRAGSRHVELEPVVVVADPNVLQVEAESRTLTRPIAGSFLEGIVLDESADILYVADGPALDVFRLDPSTLTVQDSFEIDAGRTIEGLAIPPDAEEMYIVDKSFTLGVFSLPDFEKLAEMEASDFFVEALGDSRAVSSGEAQLVVLDVERGSVLHRRPFEGLSHFTVSEDGRRIFTVEIGDEGATRAVLLNTSDLSPVWEQTIRPGRTLAAGTAFVPDGTRIYVVLLDSGTERWDFLVLDSDDGRILREMSIGTGDCAFCPGVANPVASVRDGRFVVFSIAPGPTIVDSELDLPVARIAPRFCCNVAGSENGDVFFTSGLFSGTVARVRVNPEEITGDR